MKITKMLVFQKLLQMVSRRFLHTPLISPRPETVRLARQHLENLIEIVYTSLGNPILPSKNRENLKNHEKHVNHKKIYDFPKHWVAQAKIDTCVKFVDGGG